MSRYLDRAVPLLCLLGFALAACVPQNQAGAPTTTTTTVTIDGKKMTLAQGLAAMRALTEQQVAAVPAATDRIPGRVLVVLPDRDRMRPYAMTLAAKFATNPAVVDYMIDNQLIGIRGTADALTKSMLFDSVTVSERNDTEDPDFDGYDYLIWFKVATIGPDHTGQWYGRWQVRRAPERAVQTPSFDAGVPLRDRMISFVKSIQTDAIKLGAPESAGVAASHRDFGPGGSLSGIVIDASGHIVTNNHGVQGCHDMRVRTAEDTLPARVLAQDSLNDLALLKVDHSFGATAKFRDDTPIRQGEPVTAVGFPLGDALASHASVTTGTVSALAGIHNDTRFLQFTAPVQQGNSGGPLLDGSGNVAGIVTSKLSALLVAVVTGDIPQNVNFALKKTVVESFLDANSIRYAIAAPGKESSAADIGEAAKRYTLFVECRK